MCSHSKFLPRSRRDLAEILPRFEHHGEISAISAKTQKHHSEISAISARSLQSRRDVGNLAMISPRVRNSQTSWRDLAKLDEISVKILHGNTLLKRVSYLLIFVIQENEVFISLNCDPLFFLFVNRARDPPCTTLFDVP